MFPLRSPRSAPRTRDGSHATGKAPLGYCAMSDTVIKLRLQVARNGYGASLHYLARRRGKPMAWVRFEDKVYRLPSQRAFTKARFRAFQEKKRDREVLIYRSAECRGGKEG